MQNHYWLACGAFSCMGKDWQPPQSPFVQIGPEWRSLKGIFGPICTYGIHSCKLDQIAKPRGLAGDRVPNCGVWTSPAPPGIVAPEAAPSSRGGQLSTSRFRPPWPPPRRWRAPAPRRAVGAPGASQALAATWPEAGAAYKYPQMGLTPPRLGTDKPKLLYVTKNTLIYLRKVQNVLSFLLFRGHLIAI